MALGYWSILASGSQVYLERLLHLALKLHIPSILACDR
jgi:hypothetical protein